MSTEKLDTEIRQEQILQAALQLAGSDGLKALNLANIARHVGLVPSAIYRHFPNKEALLDALLGSIQTKLLENVSIICRETDEPIERLNSVVSFSRPGPRRREACSARKPNPPQTRGRAHEPSQNAVRPPNGWQTTQSSRDAGTAGNELWAPCERSIGAGSIVAAQAGFAGSARIGRGVLVGGQAGVADHAEIGDGARLAGGAGVIGNVPPGVVVAGYPAVEHSRWLRSVAKALRGQPT